MTVGYPELLRVLGDEAVREAAGLRAAGRAEAARIVEAARAAAMEATAALLSRAAEEAGAAVRREADEAAQARARQVLGAQRERLSALRQEVAARLAAAREPGLLARLVGEVISAAPAGPFVLEVDPGDAVAAREALRDGHPEAAGRAEIREAPARRGGVALVSGRLTLDDTLPARLERAWPALEAPLARLLFDRPSRLASGEG